MAESVLTLEGLNDLVNLTLRELNEGRYTDLTSDITKFPGARQLLRQKRLVVGSGYGYQWEVAVAPGGTSYNVPIGADDIIDIADSSIKATVPFRHLVTSMAFEIHEIAANKGKRQIVDLVKFRKDMAMVSQIELIENNIFGPPVASTDSVTPWGIKTWLPKSATEGFNGGVPSGWSNLADISTTTYPRWNPYTLPYTAASKDDLVRGLRKMAEFTDFQPPVDGMAVFGQGTDWSYYGNYPIIGSMTELLEAQNENAGYDIAAYEGKVLFRKTPIEYVPILNRDSTNPLYSICWADASFIVQDDFFMKTTEVPVYPNKHTVTARFMDTSYNLVFRNRRRCGVASTGTTEPA